ncbi:MAG: 2,5-didehydrogluconate reductase DkgB [Alcanivorax sp.]|nr:2,5-didehydrogluconate reductase DkgB [Alcanivorax sp.]MBI56422.1 2,5-didehydrogluconate reductase DkgB [Alcanivorax sp.]MBU57473.1 2,5-didehydrogluconate reductase DkgB [Alcanivorax sp.]HCE41427.1 2,5-didehydrogluconate reductase DkgB [Alcanivorax sp.]|tara:strand:+ start:181 stop:993 length:813 start_codon:yes stop_codon:yes gene_type:complete
MAKASIPSLGLGTFRLKGEQLMGSIHKALDLGYRHIDTAQMYDNEETVGAALDAHDVPRDEVFLTTKIWHDRLRHDDLLKSLQESVNRLRVDSVDLALIHWPSPGDEVPMEEYIGALAEAKQRGLARHVGVSNFTVAQLEKARGLPGGEHLVTNQVEVHPFLTNRKVVEAVKNAGLTVTAYMPLAVGKVMEDDTLKKLAEKYDATPAQLVLAWLHQQDIVVIPSSTKEAHLKANLAALDLRIEDDDVAIIESLDRGERIADPDFAPDWDR